MKGPHAKALPASGSEGRREPRNRWKAGLWELSLTCAPRVACCVVANRSSSRASTPFPASRSVPHRSRARRWLCSGPTTLTPSFLLCDKLATHKEQCIRPGTILGTPPSTLLLFLWLCQFYRAGFPIDSLYTPNHCHLETRIRDYTRNSKHPTALIMQR
jgi:hypothetical protein